MYLTRREPSEVEPGENPCVVAVDPGGTTGWCVMMVHREALLDPDVAVLDNVLHWEQGEFTGPELSQARELADLLDVWEDAAVVFEDFKLRPRQPGGPELLSPVRITAILEWHLDTAYEPKRIMFKQQASMAKTAVTDDRLKSWGLYVPGKEHARDAERHALTFYRRATERAKLRVAAWPHLYG